jgi:hypothetical protein
VKIAVAKIVTAVSRAGSIKLIGLIKKGDEKWLH